MLRDESSSIGPWSEEELELTVADDTGAGDDAALPPELRFRREVQKVVRQRQSQSGWNDDPQVPAVFFLCPKPSTEIETCREPMMDSGHKQLTGRIWFVSEAVVSGHRADIPYEEDSELFDWIGNTLKLGNIPAIVINPSVDPVQLRFYSEGLDATEKSESWNLTRKSVTKDSVRTVIDEVYKTCLVSPDAQSEGIKLRNKNKYPVRNAEKLIQAQLRPGLAGAFLDCVISEEQSDSTGRYDLSITERDDIPIIHAILELKVLRSHGEGGSPYSAKQIKDWIKSGVEQAYAYRISRKATWSSLCCFDMRVDDTGEDCYKHVNTLATKLQVERWRWYLYSSSKEYRRALAS